MMSVEAIREGSFRGYPNGMCVSVSETRQAKVWQLREAARNAASSFSAVSLHNRRVEACKLPLVLLESGTV